MPLIVTPARLDRQGELYLQLGHLLGAGVPLLTALRHVERGARPPGLRAQLARTLRDVEHGATLTEALRGAGRELPAFDLALLEAGERSGRLEVCFRLLAQHYAGSARRARRTLADLAYPVFLLHFALFLQPALGFLFGLGSVAAFGPPLAFVLLLYGAVLALAYACQGRRGEAWRARMEQWLHPVPVLGAARRSLALARLAAALGALLNAGVLTIEAWTLAAAANGSPALRRRVAAWQPALAAGAPPSELVRASGEFPSVWSDLYATGEVSGKLEETLQRLQTWFEEEANRKLHALAEWGPRLAYFVIAFSVAYRVLRGWSAYFGQVNQVLGP